jgi:phenylacetate-CoA ligase
VTVEPMPGPRDSAEAAKLIGPSILTQLRRLNSEFANDVPPARQPPVVRLREIGDPEYFPPGAKHRYTQA